MKRWILVSLCLIVSFISVAQNERAISGAVFDQNGVPIPKAVVKPEGTDLEFAVNNNGTFIINVPFFVTRITAVCPGYFSQTLEVDGSYLAFKLKGDKKYAENQAKQAEEQRIAAEKAAAAAKAQAEAQAKAEAQARAKAQAKAEAQARAEAQAKAKAKAEAKSAAAATNSAKAERIQLYASKYKTKGWINDLSLGVNCGISSQGFDASVWDEMYYNTYEYGLNIRAYHRTVTVDLSYSIGYRFCNWISLGLGLGLKFDTVNFKNFVNDEFFYFLDSNVSSQSFLYQELSSQYLKDLENYTILTVPLFLDLKTYLTRTRFQPMIALKLGTDLLVQKNALKPLPLIDVGVGCNYRMNKNSSVYFLVSCGSGFTRHYVYHARCEYSYPSLDMHDEDYYSSYIFGGAIALKFRLGFTF